MPRSVIVASPDTSNSSIVPAGLDSGTVPGSCPKESGSKSFRSVKRQCSSVVSGRGRARYAAIASAWDTGRVPAVEDDGVAVRVFEEAHVAHARVEGFAEEFDAL